MLHTYSTYLLLEQNDKNSPVMKQEMLLLQEMLNTIDYKRKVGSIVCHLYTSLSLKSLWKVFFFYLQIKK